MNKEIKQQNSNNPQMGYDTVLDVVEYSYSYCTEDTIREAEKETGVKYPDCMEYVDYECFTTKATNINEANQKWLEFQKSIHHLFDLDSEVEIFKTKASNREFINHNLQQDWDRYYYDPNDI